MIAVLIPAYNAAETLAELLSLVQMFIPAKSILVVDDGSSDTTASIAQSSGVHLIQHGSNRGKGAALRSGIEYLLKETECECVLTLDADLQHDPGEIPKFLAKWQQRKTDVIVGHRRRLGSGMPLHRAMSNGITSFLVSARAGIEMKDSQCGYRCISREVLTSVTFVSDGFEAETEILVKAAQKGFRIDFVPIATIYGKERSAMTHWQTTKRFLQVLMKEY
jgi:glycosyltransferase involved in cell wall biosynthesis